MTEGALVLILLVVFACGYAFRTQNTKTDLKKSKETRLQRDRPNGHHAVLNVTSRSQNERSPDIPESSKTGGAKHHTKGVVHAPPPAIPRSMRLEGPAYVIDGDTIRIKKIKIRLAGIDAPELDQPCGQKSKWEMVRICKGHTITVELTGETSYDRLVGTCYLPDGTDIGAEIIKARLALDGGYFSQGKYRHLEAAGMRRKLSGYGHWRK